MARYRPTEQMRHIANGLREELDLANEGRNCEMLAALFPDRDDVVFPKVYWEYTSERVLVQEFIHGIPPTDTKRLEEAGLDRKVLAQRGVDAFLQMAMIEGLFHADRIRATSWRCPNRIAFIDFGIVGRLSQRRRSQLLMLIGAMLQEDADGLMAVCSTGPVPATGPDQARSRLAGLRHPP